MPNGKGKLVIPETKFSYTGEFRNGVPEGYGRMLSESTGVKY